MRELDVELEQARLDHKAAGGADGVSYVDLAKTREGRRLAGLDLLKWYLKDRVAETERTQFRKLLKKAAAILDRWHSARSNISPGDLSLLFDDSTLCEHEIKRLLGEQS
jgi:hypothetical protein